jgi:replication-associated recombination protein RarA
MEGTMALLEKEPIDQRNPLSDRVASSHFDAIPSRRPECRDLVVVYGPAGCGKSSIAKGIANSFGFTYIEGDEVSCDSPSC